MTYGNQREDALIGYLAGIIDGEGSFMLKRTKRLDSRNYTNYQYSIFFQVGMSEVRILELFKTRYGGSIKEEKVKEGRKPIFRYYLTGRDRIVSVIQETLPLLIEKKERAELVLRYVDECNFGIHRDELGKNVGLSEEEKSKREWFFFEMKRLNGNKGVTRND